jgi:hypothetical protein
LGASSDYQTTRRYVHLVPDDLPARRSVIGGGNEVATGLAETGRDAEAAGAAISA